MKLLRSLEGWWKNPLKKQLHYLSPVSILSHQMAFGEMVGANFIWVGNLIGNTGLCFIPFYSVVSVEKYKYLQCF